VPNMLRKGTVDLLLVKPISRPALIVYKYLGGLSFVFFNAAVLVFTSWVVLGLIMRVWSVYYLASILVLTAYFAVLYSFSVFIGVLTRSQLACILVTMTFWLLIFAVNAFYNIAHNPQSQLQLSDNVVAVVDAIHYVLPRMNDLSQLNQFKLAEGNGLDELLQSELKSAVEQFSWVESLVTSGAFIVLMLGLSSWWFSRADY
jgi:ABC-type transport system involved in multi-copper enzyme maturation permease subunit